MNKFKELLLYSFIIGIVISIISCTKLPTSTGTTYIKEIDTVTNTIMDSSSFRALLDCDEHGKVILRELNDTKGKLANQQIDFKDGEIVIKTKWQTKYIDRYVERKDSTTVTVTKEIKVPVKYVPKFFWICFAITILTVGGIIIKLILKFK